MAYLDTPEMKERLTMRKKISLKTVQCWMHIMEYQWAKYLRGLFIDGHEWKDVVTYCQDVFLPAWEKLGPTLHKWGDTGLEVILPGPMTCHTVMWHHYESTFYANNWHKIHWVYHSECAMPYVKGKGVLFMVADFVLADHGWLCTWMEPGRPMCCSKQGRPVMAISQMKTSSSKPKT